MRAKEAIAAGSFLGYLTGAVISAGLFAATMADDTNPILVLLGMPVAGVLWPVGAAVYLYLCLWGG